MLFRDKENCSIKHSSLCSSGTKLYTVSDTLFFFTKKANIAVLGATIILMLPITFLVFDQYSISFEAKSAGVSEHRYLPLTNIKPLKWLFSIVWNGNIQFRDDRFTCPARQSPSAVPRRGRTWPGSVCCWGEWKTEWFPPRRWALLRWWPEDTMMGESVNYQRARPLCLRHGPFHHLFVSSDLSVEHFIFLATAFNFAGASLLRPLPMYFSRFHLTPCDCLLNVQSWLNEPGLSMGATKQQHDGVFPLDCIHMVWFAAWQKESRGVH